MSAPTTRPRPQFKSPATIATAATSAAACGMEPGSAATRAMPRATIGLSAIAEPVTRMRHICIAKASRPQTPFDHHDASSSGPGGGPPSGPVDPKPIASPAATTESRIASRNGSGMHRPMVRLRKRPSRETMRSNLPQRLAIDLRSPREDDEDPRIAASAVESRAAGRGHAAPRLANEAARQGSASPESTTSLTVREPPTLWLGSGTLPRTACRWNRTSHRSDRDPARPAAPKRPPRRIASRLGTSRCFVSRRPIAACDGG